MTDTHAFLRDLRRRDLSNLGPDERREIAERLSEEMTRLADLQHRNSRHHRAELDRALRHAHDALTFVEWMRDAELEFEFADDRKQVFELVQAAVRLTWGLARHEGMLLEDPEFAWLRQNVNDLAGDLLLTQRARLADDAAWEALQARS